jgi:hypothetical protein
MANDSCSTMCCIQKVVDLARERQVLHVAGALGQRTPPITGPPLEAVAFCVFGCVPPDAAQVLAAAGLVPAAMMSA